MLVVALVGIVVNLAATWTLSKANRQSLNVEGAFQHILTDLAAFIFTAIAGAVILLTGVHRADGIASLIIAATMLYAAYGLLRDSGRVFLEAAPRGLDPDAIGRVLVHAPGCARFTTCSLGSHLRLPGALGARPRRARQQLPPDPATPRNASCRTTSPSSTPAASRPRRRRTAEHRGHRAAQESKQPGYAAA